MRSALSGSSCFFLQSTHPHSGHSARGEDRHTLQGGEELEEVDGEGGAGRTTAGGGVGCSPEGPGENRSSFERAPTEADTDMALLTMGSLNHHFKGIDRVTRHAPCRDSAVACRRPPGREQIKNPFHFSSFPKFHLSTVEMLSSLLFSSSSRAKLFGIELGSGRALRFEPRVGSGRTLKCELGSGFASFMYCRMKQLQKSHTSFIFLYFFI